MKKLISLDSPLIRFLEHIADLFILNLLTAFCSIPIITIGAAITAHYKMMQNIVFDEEQQVIKAYFKAFSQNFKQSTVVWLMTILLIGIFVTDLLAIYVYFDSAWASALYFVLIVLGIVVFGDVFFTFALIARYNNTLKEHMRNSFVLTVGNLPRALFLVALASVPILLAIISLALFLNTMIVWFFFGLSVIFYLQTLIIKPVFLRLEQKDTEGRE